jgi:hypothetical protein
MNRKLALVLLSSSLSLAATTAHAQVTVTPPPQQPQQQQCAPGQPCVVIVPQQEPQVPQGYVTVQPAQQQPVYTQQPAYGQTAYTETMQPQRQAVQTTRTRLRWGLIGPGIGLIIGGWVGNWITGLVGGIGMALGTSTPETADDHIRWSFVPWIGPWVNVGFAANAFGDDGLVGMHVLWGVLQTGGLLMCILGTVFPEEVVSMQYVLGDDPDGPVLSVLPYASQNGAGLTASIAGF